MELKKTLLLTLLCLCIYPAFSQQKDGETSKFKPHWFTQLQGGVAHTVGENNFSDLISPNAALSVGYQLNPLLGLRVNINGWQSKGGWVSPYETYKYNYIQGGVDAMLNLNNLFCKYNAKRIFNTYAFVGAGMNYGFNNDEAAALNNKESSNLWIDNKTFAVGRFGLGGDIRLSEKLSFNIEVNSNVYSDVYNSKKGNSIDLQFNALAGLTFKFGKKSKKIAAIVKPIKPIAAARPIKKEPKPVAAVVVAPKAKVEVKIEPLNENIFFGLNSATISKNEEVKINALVEYLTKHPKSKINVTSYADKDTGSPAYNRKVSQKRSINVSDMLKSKGVAANRIITEDKGDTVQPFKDNNQNRVSICIAK